MDAADLSGYRVFGQPPPSFFSQHAHIQVHTAMQIIFLIITAFLRFV